MLKELIGEGFYFYSATVTFFLFNLITVFLVAKITVRISSHSVAVFPFTVIFLFFSADCWTYFLGISSPFLWFPLLYLSFVFRSGVWPVLYFRQILKQLYWQPMCGALQLGENEPTPITGDLPVFTLFCLTVLTPLPSVPQIWDSRSLSSPCTCHCAIGGYRLEKILLLFMGKMD